MDETYIKIKGVWKYLYRAVDKEGHTVDFPLTAKRDTTVALRFFDKAIQDNAVPDKVVDEVNADRDIPITVRQVKYLNNMVEQDHQAIKRITRPMLWFKSFLSAKAVLADI